MPIISFSHPKGGVGKTTLCFNFLVYLELQKKDFVCIDLDGQNSITNLNKIRKLSGLSPFEIISFKNENSLIDFLETNQQKTIVIDSGGFDSGFNRIILSASDKILTPFSDSPLEILRLIDFDQSILTEIEKQTKQKIKIDLVINRISSNVKNLDNITSQIDNCKHFSIAKNIIRDRIIFKNSLTEGKGVLEVDSKSTSDSKAKEELNSLFKEFNL
ncbi:ParA family protein [Campylobacter jejuni]|nr:ParA family protein [Campylobacter jejuni]HED5415941.1 ParA family protein [Campylobacter jejuni]HEF7505720.1 ParA family protein [Campylobacter jejuni]